MTCLNLTDKDRLIYTFIPCYKLARFFAVNLVRYIILISVEDFYGNSMEYTVPKEEDCEV